MKISVIGCGVVGGTLVKAARQKGFTVFATDKYKPEFNDPPDKILSADLIFLCLPTPTENNCQDLSALHSVCATLSSENYQGPVVIKSTVLPGTTDALSMRYRNLKLCHNPEFLTEAKAFEDLLNQTVVLIGSLDQNSLSLVSEFWRKFDPDADQVHGVPLSSEFAKYFHNCFLAIKVSFFNEMFEACQNADIGKGPEIYQKALNMAIAIGKIGSSHTMVPGPDGKVGFGGMCFPKDTQALLTWAEIRGLRMETLEGAVDGNKRRR